MTNLDDQRYLMCFASLDSFRHEWLKERVDETLIEAWERMTFSGARIADFNPFFGLHHDWIEHRVIGRR